MKKLGSITIGIKQQTLNATMLQVPKTHIQPSPQKKISSRPVLQYGPPCVPPVPTKDEIAVSRPTPTSFRVPAYSEASSQSLIRPLQARPKLGTHSHRRPSRSLRSKGPRQHIPIDGHLVFLDFGTDHRFLFPRYSLLKTQRDGDIAACFVLVRKGSEQGSTDPSLDFYEPVTITLHSLNPLQKRALHHTVAPGAEVKAYMDGIGHKMTRGEFVVQSMRLSGNKL